MPVGNARNINVTVFKIRQKTILKLHSAVNMTFRTLLLIWKIGISVIYDYPRFKKKICNSSKFSFLSVSKNGRLVFHIVLTTRPNHELLKGILYCFANDENNINERTVYQNKTKSSFVMFSVRYVWFKKCKPGIFSLEGTLVKTG